MRSLFLATLALVGCCGAHSAEAPGGIYDRDPEHPWNRLYRAVATRSAEGIEFGSDNSEPYLDPVEDLARLNAVLDEFLAGDDRRRPGGELHQALLLNDVWAAFDLAAAGDAKPLQQKLARAVARLQVPSAGIRALPDNYAQAVKHGGFAKDFDPAQPDAPFLPADLFDPTGPWVQIDREDYPGLVAPFHVISLSGRSTFQVFMRCPGGREATLGYLQALNLYRAPWSLEPAEIARLEPSGEPVRWSPLRLNRATPQFPAGTMVALVRRMVVVDEHTEPVPTLITQSVQLRVYKKVGDGGASYPRDRIGTRQSVVDFVTRRRDLLAGRAGGLHAMARDEREYRQSHDPRVAEVARAREHRVGPVVLATCARCHQSDGVFSVLSYNQMLDASRSSNPQLLPAADPDSQRTAAVQWKKRQFDWGLLRGLLQAQR